MGFQKNGWFYKPLFTDTAHEIARGLAIWDIDTMERQIIHEYPAHEGVFKSGFDHD